MNQILVIGDVHGCYHTFRSLIEQYWQKDDILIQLGDLIDRGNFSGKTIKYVQKLQKDYPDRVVIILGNHERELIKYAENNTNYLWLRKQGKKTLKSFDRENIALFETVEWLKSLPLYWQNKRIFVSHAGIAKGSKDPYQLDRADSIIWNRQPLKNLNKVQIVGHTPTQNDRPLFDDRSNSWYIDTGACFGRSLSAIKLTLTGEFIDIYTLKTKSRDLAKFF